MVEKLNFKVHTANLLKEIADNAIDSKCGILKFPLNVFRSLLIQVAERASELNDPMLNKLMCDLTLYEISDKSSPEYNASAVARIQKACIIKKVNDASLKELRNKITYPKLNI